MILEIKMTEIAGPADGSETTVGGATLVRCANAGGTARLVTVEDGSAGTVQGSITLPAGSVTVINKDPDQFILANVTNGTYTVVASAGI